MGGTIKAYHGPRSDRPSPPPNGDTLRRRALLRISMDEPEITVYRLQACPYCERVIRVLNDLGVPYRSRFVEARHSRRNAVKRLTGSRTVPALVDDRTGVTMSESANIVRYLETTYGDARAAEADTERAKIEEEAE